MKFYETRIEYMIMQQIQRLLTEWETVSARKIALWLWLGESATRTLQRKLIDLHNLGFIEKSDTWRITSITKSGKAHFLLEDFGIPENKTYSVPILWEIACWNPIEAIEHETNRINISSDILSWNPKDYFLLKARGDSMDKAWIENGDIVLIKKQSYAENGNIVVALIDGDATLKEFKKNNNGFIALIPSSYNQIHRPIIMTSDFVILWKFIKNLGRI